METRKNESTLGYSNLKSKVSKSVSDAINYLREDIQHPNFINSKSTANFILLFNNLFDIFNSRNFYCKYTCKQPLSEKNSTFISEYLEKCKNYILGLKLSGVPIVNTGRKTVFFCF